MVGGGPPVYREITPERTGLARRRDRGDGEPRRSRGSEGFRRYSGNGDPSWTGACQGFNGTGR
jgi:hypothetical protein